jgi:hypothetical protein
MNRQVLSSLSKHSRPSTHTKSGCDTPLIRWDREQGTGNREQVFGQTGKSGFLKPDLVSRNLIGIRENTLALGFIGVGFLHLAL